MSNNKRGAAPPDKRVPREPGQKGQSQRLITEEEIQAVEQALWDGGSAISVLDELGIPKRTWNLHLRRDKALYKRIRRARNDGHDMLFDQLADCLPKIVDGQTAQAYKVRAMIIEMRAKRMCPHKYHDRQRLEHTGKGGGPIKSVHELTPEERQARIRELQEQLKLTPR